MGPGRSLHRPRAICPYTLSRCFFAVLRHRVSLGRGSPRKRHLSLDALDSFSKATALATSTGSRGESVRGDGSAGA